MNDVVEVIEDAFGSAGMGDFDREVVVARDGARFYGVYDFPTQERHIANVGDIVSLRLTLNNSFDRSCGLNWAIGLLRKVCSNGMCSLVADTNVTKKHSSKLDLSFIKEGIDASVEKFDASVEAFKNLNYRIFAAGDSYNDTTMLAAADAGFLFKAPANVTAEFSQFKSTDDYDVLRSYIDAAAEG